MKRQMKLPMNLPRARMMSAAFSALLCTASLAAPLFLSGCANSGVVERIDVTDPARKGMIQLDLGSVAFVNEYNPPYSAPNVDHLMQTTPSLATRNWLNSRYSASGANGLLRVTVKDASMIEENLGTASVGLKRLFTVEQTERYAGRIELRIDVEQPEIQKTTTITVVAERATTVPETASLSSRETAWSNLTRLMMADIDAAVEDNLRAKVPDVVR